MSYLETDFFITTAAALNVYCLPEFLLHMTILKARFHSSNRKKIDPSLASSDRSVFQFQGLSKSVLVGTLMIDQFQ